MNFLIVNVFIVENAKFFHASFHGGSELAVLDQKLLLFEVFVFGGSVEVQVVVDLIEAEVVDPSYDHFVLVDAVVDFDSDDGEHLEFELEPEHFFEVSEKFFNIIN